MASLTLACRPPSCFVPAACSSSRHCGVGSFRTATLRRLPSYSVPRLASFVPRCSSTNVDVDHDHVETEEKNSEDLSSIRTIPIIHLRPDILHSKPLNILLEGTSPESIFAELPVLSEGEQEALAATPAHPGALYALYGSSLLGNLVEQLWGFVWPAAVAILHPSLVPVAVVGFFAKLAVFIAAPIVGKLMDHFPRVPAYNILNIVQTAAQLLSAGMIIYAFKTVKHSSSPLMLLQPWYIALVLAGSVERLAGLALGVTMERDWVVMLAGTDRPIALARANSMLSRIDLICEISGASIFGILLSKYSPVTCLKVACGLMMCALPVLVVLGQLIDRLSNGILDCSRFSFNKSVNATTLFDAGKIVKKGLDVIKHGWNEYKHQPVLPASLTYVFLYFNIALAPGSIMTAVLMQNGVSPSIIGAFSGLGSIMGVAATFSSAALVKELGILKAGAAGLILQGFLLTAAVAVYWTGSITERARLFVFLSLIMLSRLGHMSYDVVGTQILQIGIPASKANLIGTTEVSIASLAEFLMLGVAIVANDASHFGFLATLSLSSVVGAAYMFCQWLANPTEEHRRLFKFT